MAQKTGIAWTNSTWNPVRGCTRISPGCENCYAERMAAQFSGPGEPYHGLAVMTPSGPRWTRKVRLIEEHLEDPIRWKRPRMIFVNSMSDLFHEDLAFEVIDRIFAVMARAPRHIFQVLTKRPARMAEYVAPYRWMNVQSLVRAAEPDFKFNWPLPHVWLGVSIEDQRRADERRAAVADLARAWPITWVSYEPALGPVDWGGWEFTRWIVGGGESGPGARPSEANWYLDTRAWCQAHGIAYFHKQMGTHLAHALGMSGKGEDFTEFPEGFRLREYPAALEPANA